MNHDMLDDQISSEDWECKRGESSRLGNPLSSSHRETHFCKLYERDLHLVNWRTYDCRSSSSFSPNVADR